MPNPNIKCSKKYLLSNDTNYLFGISSLRSIQIRGEVTISVSAAAVVVVVVSFFGGTIVLGTSLLCTLYSCCCDDGVDGGGVSYYCCCCCYYYYYCCCCCCYYCCQCCCPCSRCHSQLQPRTTVVGLIVDASKRCCN